MRISRGLAGAALLAALAAACKPAPPAPAPDPTDGVALTAPSSSTIASPLGPSTGTFTNEMQAQSLRDQAQQLGITRLSRPSTMVGGDGDKGPHRTITYQEGIERTRDMARDAEAERHAIEGDKNKSVAIPTDTAGVVPGKKEGAPIENAPENQ